MKSVKYGLVVLFVGCATAAPEEPYLWRDDAAPVGVHRADVARAEARVIDYLVSSGTILQGAVDCKRSSRAYHVVTAETPDTYEISLFYRPGLCSQAPEDDTLPPFPPTYERPLEFAVRKRDLHIIRMRLGGDASIPWVPKAEPAPAPKMTLAFTTPNPQATVGACAGPVGIETRDSSGAPKVVAAPVVVDLTAAPPSAVFFSDPKCTQALATAVVAAVASRSEIYFRALQAGSLQITAAATGWSSETHTYAVEPAPAVTVVFTTPPQTVSGNSCSGEVTVQARDALGNPANVASPTPVRLQVTPAKATTFYASPGCTGASITSIDIPASSNSASFYFKGRRPQAIVLSAALDAVRASQDEVITPTEATRQGTPSQKGR